MAKGLKMARVPELCYYDCKWYVLYLFAERFSWGCTQANSQKGRAWAFSSHSLLQHFCESSSETTAIKAKQQKAPPYSHKATFHLHKTDLSSGFSQHNQASDDFQMLQILIKSYIRSTKKNTHNPNSFNILQSLRQRPSLSTNKQFYNDIWEVLTLASLVLKMVSNYLEKIKGGCSI